ncbi:ABC transporter permease [Amycolatopsis taiwanensis]|uniref:Transport permease protein n=1 Tax=Amycolatopsis taiwanensis TaxID=342230 RepID=A0A9W6R0I2_9PSEU|nr:ABC transporter permease [Amycolatopsis taiwanensis]GLY65402.1 transport permease protein [Amycolatopsis taiwanensis]
MTTFATTPDRPADRLRWALADIWTITLRDLQRWRNNPGVKIFGWLFPVLTMAMFTGLLGGAIGAATGARYVDFVMPGAFAMAMVFGLEGTMMTTHSDAAKGVTDRFRSLPMSGIAVVAGRCAADMIDSLVSLIVIVSAGLVFGWRSDASAAGIAAAFALLLLLRFAMLWIGVFIGLKATSPGAVTSVQVAIWPVLLLSSALIDTSTMPRWLGTIAEANPLSATATAARELLHNPVFPGGSWFAENALLLAVAWPAVLVAIFLPLSVFAYRHRRQ